MTGDGVNDAPALAQLTLVLLLAPAVNIAAEDRRHCFGKQQSKGYCESYLFGKATYKKMIQNLVWATGYNVLALPLAAGVLFKAGYFIKPAAGAVLMSLRHSYCCC
jgi:Cu2+-exporting ATPase